MNSKSDSKPKELEVYATYTLQDVVPHKLQFGGVTVSVLRSVPRVHIESGDDVISLTLEEYRTLLAVGDLV